MARRAAIGLVAGSVLVATAGMEVGLRLVYPLGDPYPDQRAIELGSYIPRRHQPAYRLTVEAEPGLPGVSGTSVFRTNPFGFVGPEADADAPRIFLLGGSTMEAVVLGEDNNPATLMMSAFRRQDGSRSVNVQNTAHSGDASYDHVAMLSHRLVHLRPTVIVVLAGVNDLIAAVRGKDYRHLQPDRTVALSTMTLLKLGLTRAQVGRLVWVGLGKARLRRWDVHDPKLTTHYAAAARACRDLPVTETLPTLNLEAYERNLRTLVGIATAHGVSTVFASQPHSWRSEGELVQWHWMRCLGGRRYAATAMAEGLEAYNRTTQTVAETMGVVFVDLAGRLSGNARILYDDVHFNEVGARVMADALVTAVEQIPQ